MACILSATLSAPRIVDGLVGCTNTHIAIQATLHWMCPVDGLGRSLHPILMKGFIICQKPSPGHIGAGGPVPRSHQQLPHRTLSTPLPPQPTALTLKQACSHPLLGSETHRADAAEDTATSPAAESKQRQQVIVPNALSTAAARYMWAPTHAGSASMMSGVMPQQITASAGILPPGTAQQQAGGMPGFCHIKEEPGIKQEVSRTKSGS